MVAMADAKWESVSTRLVRARAWVQGLFLLVWLDPLMLRMHNVCSPVFHCYSCPLATFACPIGVVAQFGALHLIPFLAIGTLLLAGGLAGAFICGWLCPFGFLQDVLGKIPTRRVPLPRWTGYGRYVVLAGLVIAVPILLGSGHALFICRVCPVGALEGALPLNVGLALNAQPLVLPSLAKMAVVVLIVTAMFLTWRPWCRLFCPLGAIYGIMNRGSAVFLRLDRAGCTDCGRCARQCRYGVHPGRDPGDSRCIRCLECTACEALTVGHVFESGGCDAASFGSDGPAE
jgi:polyferredoxin